MPLKVIAFDADDTLWHNEAYFQEAEKKFCALFEDYMPQHSVARELLKTEIQNISLYGYGIKGFILSMIETAIRITDNRITADTIWKIVEIGRAIADMPVNIIPGVEEVLTALRGKYRLVLATKGDLTDQERKLRKSGLERFFHHIEIMSEKKEEDYRRLIKRLDIQPEEFVMIGNSIKSDVLPVLNIGGHGIHIPYHITWEHERVETQVDHANFKQVEKIKAILEHFSDRE
jgi:putative hydrolase of the HAD superfamily